MIIKILLLIVEIKISKCNDINNLFMLAIKNNDMKMIKLILFCVFL
jgi:hypothetical protein